ncbi:hypothetical protein BC827DRAFT_1215321 [Russula dissimulans]|nr:hypothetical protein BC827DRAFT_1215321 [Russula dissimulans]
MFGFFSRKQQQAANVSNLQSDAMAIDSEPQQLRTPSPSEAAFNNGPGGPAVNANVAMASPPAPAQVPPTPEALHSLVTTIPAKTLHSYVLAHIPTAPPDTLVSLASFFATLAPPPLLHCVRCHADYTEIENDDRSCHVPHDDDSAEVEWIGSRGKYEYETYYGCCSRTVEGEGDLGPPDGWCYEGMHTTDIKRARFRADSTLADDKLVTCLELNCHNIRSRLQSAKASTSASPRRAKRARPPPGEGDVADDDGASAGTEDTGIAEIALGDKGKGKGKAKERAKQPKAAAAAAPASTSKPARARARVRVLAPHEPESDGGNSSKAGSVSAPAPAPAPEPAPAARQRRRLPRPRPLPDGKPRSSASSAGKVAAAAASPPSSPNLRGRKPPSGSKMDSVEIVVRSPSRSRTRSRVRGSGAETGEEKTMTDSEGKVRKRRKVAPAATV